MHAVGHAAVSLLAGALAALLLGGRPHLVGAQRSQVAQALHAPLVGFLGDSRARLADSALVISALGLAVVCAKGLAGVYATYVQGIVSGEVGAALRLELLDALLAVHRLRRPRHADHGPLDPSPHAYSVAALTERVHEVELGLKVGLLGGLRAVAQLVPLAALLVVLSARTAAFAGIVLTVFGALLGKARAGYGRAARNAALERTRLLEAADESVRHADLWVSYGAEAKARRRVAELGQAIARGAARLEARAAALSAGNEVLGAAALTLAVGVSRTTWLGGSYDRADGGTLLAFAVAFFLAYRPVREVTEARLALERAGSAFWELTAMMGRGVGAAEASSASSGERACEREGPVSRAWPLAALELRSLRLPRGACGPLTLHVEPGSLVVLTGPTGVGKTTLLRTLLGLERAREGDVVFDGISIVDEPAGPRARPFAWVPQGAPLLADTLDANVALGAAGRERPGDQPGDGGEDAAAASVALAALDPLGAGHLSGALGRQRLEGGGRAVSGGERQWIALARAIATRQPVLLLDEPTSGLDEDAQRRVLDAIDRLRGVRTVLLVTHRPEPIDRADVVVRLDDKGLLEDAA